MPSMVALIDEASFDILSVIYCADVIVVSFITYNSASAVIVAVPEALLRTPDLPPVPPL